MPGSEAEDMPAYAEEAASDGEAVDRVPASSERVADVLDMHTGLSVEADADDIEAVAGDA